MCMLSIRNTFLPFVSVPLDKAKTAVEVRVYVALQNQAVSLESPPVDSIMWRVKIDKRRTKKSM